MRSITKRLKFTHYFTSITQKAQGAYKRVLEGAGVGVIWSNMVDETGETGKNTEPGRAITTLPHARTRIGFEPGLQR